MKRFCGHLALSLALLLFVPALTWAAGIHYFNCKECHKTGVSLTNLASQNLCLQCHVTGSPWSDSTPAPGPGYDGLVGNSVFSVDDASNAFGGNPTGTGQTSHIWAGTAIRPAAGAQEPTTAMAGFYGRYKVSDKKLTCTRCHNPHGVADIGDGDPMVNPKLLIRDSLNGDLPMAPEQNCRACHVPFDQQNNRGLVTHPVVVNYGAVLAQPEYQGGGAKEGWLQPAIDNGGGQGTVQGVNAEIRTGSPATYVNGVGCVSCHAPHFADSSSATSDGPGVTLNAGDGKLLRSDGALRPTDTPPNLGATTPAIAQLRSNLCQACHTFKSHGSVGTQVGCLDCHSGHTVGSANYFVLRSQVGATTGLNYTTLSPLHGGATAVDDLWSGTSAGDSTGYCERCHGQLTAMPGSARAHVENENCRTCHAHDGATFSFEAVGGCTGCHGTPPTQNVAGGDPNAGYAANYVTASGGTIFKDESITPHAAHAAGGTDYSFTCNVCHLNNSHDTGTFQDVFVGGSYDSLASGSGNLTPFYNTANPGTCSSVYCHSNGGQRTGDGTRTYTAATIPAWTAGSTTGAITTCNACHDGAAEMDGVADKNSAAHAAHIAKGYTCNVCHMDTADNNTTLAAGAIGGKHVNNAHDVVFNTSYSLGAANLTTASYPDPVAGTCAVYCHSNGSTLAAPDWDVPASGNCGSCHKYDSNGDATQDGSGPALAGAHQIHVFDTFGPRLACTVCHSNDGSGADHVNGAPSFVANYQNNVCNPCHGAANGVSSGDDRQPIWTSAASVECQTCHAGSEVAVISSRVAPNKSQALVSGHTKSSGNYLVSGNVAANRECFQCHDDNNKVGHIDGVGGNATRLLALAANCTTSCHGVGGSAVKDGIVTHVTQTCTDCHDPHGSGNIYMVKANSTGGYSGSVVFTATSGGDSYDEADADNSDDLCATCHTAGNQTIQHNNKTNTGVAHNEGTDCFTCHRSHTNVGGAFVAGAGSSCNGCHGFPPATAAHAKHAQSASNDKDIEDRSDCAFCHTGADLYTYDTAADQLAGGARGNHALGDVNQKAVLTASVGYNTTNFNCASACHASTASDGFWADANGLNCNACHYYNASPTSAGNVTAGNSEALGGDHSVHFGLGGVVTCADCHVNPSDTTHISLATGTDIQKYQDRAQADQDEADVTAAALGSGSDPDPGNATCNNAACHNPSGTTYSAQWNVTVGSCTTCHSTTDPGTGSHDEHLAAGVPSTFGINTIACTSCHGTNPSSNAHRNGVVNFTTTPATMGYTGGAEDVGGTLGTCTTSTCHNDGTAAATPVQTPQWGTTSPNCTICHGNAPSTGEHTKHFANTNYVDGGCADCHTAANVTTHINGVRNIAGQITDMDLGVGGNQLVAPGGWNGTCANACHIANTAGDWAAGTLACTDCHGSGKVTTPAMDRGWPPSSGAHAKHLANTAYVNAANCTNCHNDNSSTHSTLNNVVTPAVGTAAQRITVNPGNGSCTNTCHAAAQASDWTGGSAAITCTDCHAGTYIGGGANGPVSGLHVGTPPSVTGQLHNQTVSGGCAACHPNVMAQTATHIKGTFTGNGSVPGDRTAMGLAGFYTTDGSDNLGTCLTTGCHTSRDDWAHKWMATANYTSATLSCQGCHGSNLASAGLGNAGVTHRTVAVKHNGVATNYTCRDCHAIEGAGYTFTFGTQDWGGGSNHGNGQVDINNTGTSYNQGTGYCETCHNLDGRNFADTGWTINPVAGTAISTTCGECHYDGVTTGAASTSHTAHGITTADLQAGGAECIVCHGNNGGNNFQNTLAGSHGTGTVDLNTSRITAYPGGLVKWDGSESTCTNNCHNTAGGQVWDVANGLACSSCHYYEAVVNSANNTGSTAVGGSHNAHFAAAAVTACTQCHPNNSADTTAPRTHIGGTTLLERSSEALVADNAEMTPLGAAFNDTNKTCNNTACHNPSSESYVSNAWGTPNAGCTMCHGDMTTKPTTGSHLVHLNASGNGFGISPTCTSCHPNTADPAHMNSVKNVEVAKNSVVTTVASPTAAGGCGTNDCHNNGVSLTTGTPLASTYTWGTPITDCTECHGAATTLTSNAHNEHMNNGYASPACTDCHTAANQASHINKNINLDAAKATYSRTASVAIGGTPNGTCSTASCHNRGATGQPAQSAAWNTAGDLTCNSCHGDATAGLSTSHGDHLSAGKTCAQCHDTLPTTTAHISNKSTLIDGAVAASGEANITFVNVAAVTDYTYNSTEHSCYSPTNNGLGCHATAGSAGAADPTRPDWDVAFAATACTNCHTNTSTAAVNPTSGLHGVTPSVTGQRHDSSISGGCVACHNTMPQFTNHKNGAFTGDTMGDLGLRYYTQSAANTGTCLTTTCHTGRDDWAHKWMATANYTSATLSCQGCHGSNLASAGLGNAGVTHRTVTVKHNAVATNYTCRDCHAIEGAGYTFTFGTQDWGGGSNHGNGQVDVNSTGTSYNQTNGYCESCHTTGAYNFADTGWTINPVAGTAISIACGECHANGVKPGSASGAHTIHNAGTAALVAGGAACVPCHGNNGGNNYQNTLTGTHGSGSVNFAGVTYSTAVRNDLTGTCTTTLCHNSGAVQSTAWNSTQLNCNSCHFYPTTTPTATVTTKAANLAHARPLSAAHGDHFDGGKLCTQCHGAMPAAGDTSHVSGTTLQDKAVADRADDDATVVFTDAAAVTDYTFENTGNTCYSPTNNGLGCHATAGSAGAADPTRPDWDLTIAATACTACHTNTTTAAVNPTSGLHAAGTLTSSMPHDDSFATGGTCVTCHTAVPALGGAHINGIFTANDTTANNEYYTLATMYTDAAQNSGTCSGATAGAAGCHSDGGAWGRKWSTTAYNSDGTQCVNCHSGFTNPAVIGSFSAISGMSLRHFTNDANSGIYNNHGGGSGAPCYQCHGYKAGDTTYYNIANFPVGQHRDGIIQLNNQNTFVDPNTDGTVRCDGCHTTPYGTADGQFSFEDTYNGDANGFARWGRDLTTVTGPAGGCNACHGGVDGSSNPQYWPDGVGSGYQDSSAGAHDNHILALADHLYGITTLNALRADATTDAKQKAICAFCHPNPGEAGHNTNVNGGTYNSPSNQVDLLLATTFRTYDGNLASKVDTTSGAYNYTTLTCSNLACHNQVTTPSSWNTPPVTPTCAICHTGAGASQRHDVHVTTKGYACTQCHTNHGTYPGGTGAALRHADGEIQLVWNNAGSFENTYGGGSVTYSQAGALKYKDATWGTCASAACHNNKTTPAWSAAATAACTVCHTIQGSGTVDPYSGLHRPGTLTSNMPHDDSFATGGTCATCHSSMPGTHIDGTPAGNTAAAMGLTAGMYTQTSTAGFGSGTCSGGAVSGAGCHGIDSIDAGSWKRLWNDTISYQTNGTECAGCHGGFGANDWTFGSAASTTDYEVSHGRDWDAASSSNDGAEVIGNHSGSTQATKCNICHVYGDGAYLWSSNHRDRKITMNSRVGYNNTAYNCSTNCHTEPWGNTNHSMEAASSGNWTTRGSDLLGPALACVSCHSAIYNAGAGSHIDADGPGAAFNPASPTGLCEACHGSGTGPIAGHWVLQGTAAANRVGISTISSRVVNGSGEDTGTLVPTMNKQYSSHDSYILLGGTATSNAAYTTNVNATTEAEMCWGCHDRLGTVSEWGVNNKAKTGNITYDYGDLYTDVSTVPGTKTSNWVTGKWRSGKGRHSNSGTNPFWYKRGSIQSTHSVNFDSGVSTLTTTGNSLGFGRKESPDAVANIRCTYCHDVHGTHNGINGDTSGGAGTADSPYLRGTWKGNPYPEDGAPQLQMRNWTVQGTTMYGVVPRASAANSNSGLSAVTQAGGWWIDQNSNNPNSNTTVHATSGLCEQCHGSNKTGTWNTAPGGSLATLNWNTNGVGEANIWVSGYNGHANAVLDAPGRGTNGSAESYARNIFTRTKRGSAALSVAQSDKLTVDMGLMTDSGGRGYSYRASTTSTTTWAWTPRVANSTYNGTSQARVTAFSAFAWGDPAIGAGGRTSVWATGSAALTMDTNATEATHDAQANYHTFTCSKCHNPHASRLPKLMITNCLDTNHNTWEDDTFYSGGAFAAPWTNTRHSQWASAQNCHRLDARAALTSGQTVNLGRGWNRVTPWLEFTSPNSTRTTITPNVAPQ